MWERLRQSDIVQAKQALRLRVDETLRRHAAEIKGLDADLAEVEMLNRLVDAFSAKFGTTPRAAFADAPPPADKGEEAPASNSNATTERRASNIRQLDPAETSRGAARTNFDAFSRAMGKTDRW
ncbi:MAG: hypothetical protein ACM3JG_11450 [Thiohalocapsa sp.]